MVVIAYFLIWRPQQQEQAKKQSMLDSLSKGDRIITASGLHGSVVAVHDATLRLMIAPKVEVTLDKTSVTAKMDPQAAAAPSASN